jgi:hypothetical protein
MCTAFIRTGFNLLKYYEAMECKWTKNAIGAAIRWFAAEEIPA